MTAATKPRISRDEYGIRKIAYWWARLRLYGLTDREIFSRLVDKDVWAPRELVAALHGTKSKP
jgi:hypothetical protein